MIKKKVKLILLLVKFSGICESGIYSDPQTERSVQRFGSFELEYKNRILSSSLEQDFELSND